MRKSLLRLFRLRLSMVHVKRFPPFLHLFILLSTLFTLPPYPFDLLKSSLPSRADRFPSLDVYGCPAHAFRVFYTATTDQTADLRPRERVCATFPFLHGANNNKKTREKTQALKRKRQSVWHTKGAPVGRGPLCGVPIAFLCMRCASSTAGRWIVTSPSLSRRTWLTMWHYGAA